MDNFFFDKTEFQVLYRLQTVDPDLYFQLLKTHLSYFMDDIPPGALQVNYFSSTTPTKKPKRTKMGSNKTPSTGIIGAPLTQEGICRLHQLIEFIGRDENICQRNLFRRPGNISRQENLKFRMNSGAPLDIDTEAFTVYDCCEVLKKFLAELKEPLLPADIYNVFRLIPGMVMAGATRNQVERIQCRQLSAASILLLLVPTESCLLLYNILTLLTSIMAHKEDNQANAESLSVLFTPSVLLPRKLNASDMTKELPVAVQIMTFLIENMPRLYKPPVTLLQDVKRHLRIAEEGSSTDLSLPARISYCSQVEKLDTEAYTEFQLQKLKSDMEAIPDCSQKKLFQKKMKEQNNELTPDRNNLSGGSHSRSLFSEPLRKYLVKSFRRKKLYPFSGSTDRLSNSLSDTSPPVLKMRKKSSYH